MPVSGYHGTKGKLAGQNEKGRKEEEERTVRIGPTQSHWTPKTRRQNGESSRLRTGRLTPSTWSALLAASTPTVKVVLLLSAPEATHSSIGPLAVTATSTELPWDTTAFGLID